MRPRFVTPVSWYLSQTSAQAADGASVRAGHAALSVDVEAEKQLEALIDAGKFARRYLPKDSSNAALVNRSKVIDKSIRRLRETTRTWRQRRIQRTIAGRPRNREYCDERESLVGIHNGIADGDTRPNGAVLVADGRVELHEYDRASIECHADSLIQP